MNNDNTNKSIIVNNNKHSRWKCLLGLHDYVVYNTEELKDFRNNLIGKVIINRCACCGKIQIINVYTIKNI